MNTITNLFGFEFPNPDKQTIPSVTRIIGPLEEEAAIEWLRARGFTQTHPREWIREKPSTFLRLVDGKSVERKVAVVSANIQILDAPADVEVKDSE